MGKAFCLSSPYMATNFLETVTLSITTMTCVPLSNSRNQPLFQVIGLSGNGIIAESKEGILQLQQCRIPVLAKAQPKSNNPTGIQRQCSLKAVCWEWSRHNKKSLSFLTLLYFLALPMHCRHKTYFYSADIKD